MKDTACLICGAHDADRLAQYEHDPYHRHLDHLKETPVTYVVCRRCGFVYTNPMLDERELATLYGEKLRPEPPGSAYLKANRNVYLPRYQWISRELGVPNDRRPSPTMLEVGCAAGVALSIFREYGWQTSGIEPADTFASYARDSFGLDVQTGFYGPDAFEGRTFDLIMFSQVLEHVPDPDALLAQARRNLADDGHVFIGIPTLMRPMRPVHPMTLQAIHLWIFSMPTLRLLLERNGFAPVTCTYDQKGLMVLARKAAVRGWREGAGDNATRVKRYFADYTASDSLYARNLAALYSVGKDYGRPADMDADLSAITVEAAPQGYLNLCERKDGNERWLYDSDPREGAERSGQQFDFGIEGVVVLLGLGLGYLAHTVLSKIQRGHSLVICEADPRVFHAAMFHQDLTAILNDSRVHLVVGDDLNRLDFVLGRVSKTMFAADKMHTVRCSASVKWNKPQYDRFVERVKDRMKVLEINRNTIGNLGPRMLKNTLENAHLTIGMPGVSRFAGLFKGCPAIVVSAGPSLEKNLHLLREAKGRAVIIACDTVLRLLVPHGVVPDVTITADPHEATYRKFRDLPMNPDSILVCHPANYPDIYRTFAGRRFTTDTGGVLYKFLSRFWSPKGRVDHQSQSSAHQAFNVATLIGADPIIFVGQDLCCYESKKHAGNLTQGSPYDGQLPAKERDRTKDILGRPVETTTLFMSFKIMLEDLIKQSPARVINATEGGLGIRGTEVMTLRDAIDDCCPAEPIDITGRFVSKSGDEPGEMDAPGLRAELRRIHAEARETLKISQKMLKYVEKAQKLIKRGQEDGKQAQHLSELAERTSLMMDGRKELMGLLLEGAYWLELYMTREDTKTIDEIADPHERFRKQIERARRYYSGLKEVLASFVDGTALLLERLDELVQVRALPVETVPQKLQAALRYKRLEDYPRAKDLYEAALKEAPDNLEAQFHLGDILYRCHRAQDALPLLRQVAARAPRYMNVEELVRRCREKAEAWARKVAEAHQVRKVEYGDDQPLYAGELYWRAGDLAKAERKFQEAIRLTPSRPEPYLDLALLREEAGDPESALSVFADALAALPDHPLLLKELGLFSVRHKQGDQAETFLRAAVALDPALSEVGGDGLYLAGRFLAAGELYEEALRRDPANQKLALKAAAAYRQCAAAPMLASVGGRR
jgi:SAM-dependent methyltransferase/Tfp pilus assembly protein PilF